MTCGHATCIYCEAVNPDGVRVEGLTVPSLTDDPTGIA